MTTTSTTPAASYQHGVYPDARGRYGDFGGRFVPESLMAALAELEQAYDAARADADFAATLADLERTYTGRPTPLYFARAALRNGWARASTSSAKTWRIPARIRSTTRWARDCWRERMGKRRIIAETGAGQHGVATATVCARQGLECVVYMGEEDIQRQSLNVFRMKLLGAEVRPVSAGSRTLKDAINEALRDWVTNVETTHYLIGSAVGPHPYPRIVRDFQSVIGRETRAADARRRWAAARCRGRLRRRRQQRHRHVPSLRGRCVGAAGGRGGWRAWRRERAARGDAGWRATRCAAWRAQLSAAGCAWPGDRDAQHLRRAGLSRRRAGAQLPEGDGPRQLCRRR